MNEELPWEVPRIRNRVKPWVLDGFLTSYQREAWSWLHQRGNEGSNLWWACGAGKTLAALLFLISGEEGEKKIIVTRATTKRQWQREAAQYTDLKLQILSGQGAEPIDHEVEAVVISWEILPHWLEALLTWAASEPYELSIVFDEIHKGKSHKRKERYVTITGGYGYRWLNNRVSAAARLARLADRRLGLTATPIRDRRSDLWGQLDLIQPGRHGSSWDWMHYFCDARPGQYGGLDTSGKSNCDELKDTLDGLTHAVSYAEMARSLPPKRRRLLYISAGELVRAASFMQELKSAAKRGPSALFETQLMQTATMKRKLVVEHVWEDIFSGTEKVVVFTGRRQDCTALTKAISKKLASLNVPVFSGHGGDSLSVREDEVKAFAGRDGAAVFVGTTDAFGEAIDGLQCTDSVYFALLPWTPGQVTQAEGRFSRHGSDRPVLITYLIAEGTVDEHVADLLLDKLEDVADITLDEEAEGLADTLAGVDDEEELINSILEVSLG